MMFDEWHESDRSILSPIGRLDHETSPSFQAKLLQTLATPGIILVLDMAGVEFIFSSGVSALMTAARQSKILDGSLVIVSLQPVIKEILAISRLSLDVPIFDAPPGGSHRPQTHYAIRNRT